MPEIASLFVGDRPDVWRAIGFEVDDQGASWTSGVRHQLGADGRGVIGWALRHVPGASSADSPTGPLDVDGITTAVDVSETDPASAEPHPNGVISLDHVVLTTPDVARTTAALEAIGFEVRRTRETSTYGTPMLQSFFRAGPVVLELVGPERPSGDGPPRFYGLAWTVADLDATAAHLDGLLHAPKDAVQPGRRIATLDRAAGSTVRMAFMSPGPG